MKHVLVLGAGLVVKPLLDDLLAEPDLRVRLATLNIDRARQLLAGQSRGEALVFNALDESKLLPEVERADAVVSLLPADQHVHIAEACLRYRVPLVTTSYISAGMQALDAQARELGVLLLNETGLDPGIDHMTAVHLIRRVREEGGEITGLLSYCGGFPAPESNDNPWGYKFAWSPRGVIMAVRNAVRYIEEGRVVERVFPALFDNPRRLDVPGVGPLVAFPNRDCLRYLPLYGLGDGLEDFYRGTLRYAGWCESWQALYTLGLIDLQPASGASFAEVLEKQVPGGGEPLPVRTARRLGIRPDHPIIERLAYLGLFSDAPLPAGAVTPLDAIALRMQERLQYAPGERDLVVLRHEVHVRMPDGRRRVITATLMSKGVAGDDSAMARTVSTPAAIACRLVLQGNLNLTGVQIPVDERLSEPVLAELERMGLHTEVQTRYLERRQAS